MWLLPTQQNFAAISGQKAHALAMMVCAGHVTVHSKILALYPDTEDPNNEAEKRRIDWRQE